jgi:porin
VTRALATILFTTQFGAYAVASEREPDAADESAYELGAAYTADLWRNATGGLRTGGVYLDNLDVTLAVDGERAWGARGWSAFVYGLYNNSARFSERYVGDAMTVSNIDAAKAWRLYEAWLQWESASTDPWSVRFGLYDLNSEFDVSDSRSLFVHSTHGVGHELGQTGVNGPSIFPVTSLAVRTSFAPAPGWRVLLGVFDAVPGDPDHPSSNRIRVNSEEGALGIAEVQWSGERVTKLSLGSWRYTAEFEDVRSSDDDPRPVRDGNAGTYAAIEVKLDRAGAEPNTLAFLRYGVANDRINEFKDALGLGVRRRALFAARPDDEFGLAFSRTSVGDPARAAGAAAGAPRDAYEAAIELTYRAPITSWLTLQPDVQYILNPGADRALDDSLAFGLRLEFSAAAFR